LAGELVPDAVNVKGGEIHEDIRPALPLVEKLAQLATALVDELPVSIEVLVKGEVSAHDCSVLASSALKGALAATGAEDVTYVNAPGLAQERGLTSNVLTDPISPEYRNSIAIRAAFSNGAHKTVEGTLMGIRRIEKIIAIDKFDLDLQPADHLLFLRYTDRPGIVGVVGQTLGAAGINIASMQVARNSAGGDALMAITIDSAAPEELVRSVGNATKSDLARTVSLKL
jgi:D-3-phosphoglycerate dehydrogenase